MDTYNAKGIWKTKISKNDIKIHFGVQDVLAFNKVDEETVLFITKHTNTLQIQSKSSDTAPIVKQSFIVSGCVRVSHALYLSLRAGSISLESLSLRAHVNTLIRSIASRVIKQEYPRVLSTLVPFVSAYQSVRDTLHVSLRQNQKQRNIKISAIATHFESSVYASNHPQLTQYSKCLIFSRVDTLIENYIRTTHSVVDDDDDTQHDPEQIRHMHNALKGRQRRYALKPCPRDTVEMDILWNLQRSTDDNDLHPNIIKLYQQHSKYKPDLLFMTLEYVDTELKFLLSRHPLPTPLIKYVMYNIANELCEVHRLNIVHRDMKLDKYVFDAIITLLLMILHRMMRCVV
eukprot:1009659_1